jgi:hypothetical protein
MNNSLRTGLMNTKWLMLMVFLGGYALTAGQFDQRLVEYSFLNLVAFVSCAVLLTQIDIFNRAHYAAWLALTLLVMGYFIRFYWIAIDPMPVERMLPWNPFRTMIANRDALFLSFKLSVAAFTLFNISVAALALYYRRVDLPSGLPSESTQNKPKVSAGLWLMAVLLLMAALAFVTYTYRIGEMGAESGEPLPFRMNGIVGTT